MNNKEKICNYIKGLSFKPKPVMCNFKETDYIVIASCHPKKSINWKWVLWINKPKSWKWIFNMGFKLHVNKRLYWYEQ